VFKYFKGMSEFVRDEGQKHRLVASVLDRSHDDPQITVLARNGDVRQETAVEMTERAMAVLDVNDSVRSGDLVREPAER
jgi:hypothetical protein